MSELSRRDLLRQASLGLAVAGATSLTLQASALPTEPSGTLPDFGKPLPPFVQSTVVAQPAPEPPAAWSATEDNILGPYFRKAAPFRAKITPPFEPGMVMVVRGRVWGYESKKPLEGVRLEIWQANTHGRYDNDDPAHPPAPGVFANRARLITDETGYYEFETIHPGRYKNGPEDWRPSHIHYFVHHAGHKELVTQLYFKGDPYNATDAFIKTSLIREAKLEKLNGQTFELVTFDIVLA